MTGICKFCMQDITHPDYVGKRNFRTTECTSFNKDCIFFTGEYRKSTSQEYDQYLKRDDAIGQDFDRNLLRDLKKLDIL